MVLKRNVERYTLNRANAGEPGRFEAVTGDQVNRTPSALLASCRFVTKDTPEPCACIVTGTWLEDTTVIVAVARASAIGRNRTTISNRSPGLTEVGENSGSVNAACADCTCEMNAVVLPRL